MEAKKQYFYVTSDEGKNFFDSREKLLEFIVANTSDEETVEVGCEELTATEWARIEANGDDSGRPYKDEDVATVTQ